MEEMAKVVADCPNVWTDTAYMAIGEFPRLHDYEWHGRLMFGTDLPVWQANGHSCTHSPTMKHEHVDDEKHCEWCGSSSYGSACPFSPTGKHRHGHGANKCIWCG